MVLQQAVVDAEAAFNHPFLADSVDEHLPKPGEGLIEAVIPGAHRYQAEPAIATETKEGQGQRQETYIKDVMHGYLA